MNPLKYVGLIYILVVLSACIVLSGCATSQMANPTATPDGQTLIESDPPGARIEINNQHVGTTLPANPTATPDGQTLIESDPPGARIEINNQYVGTTPLRVDIPRLNSQFFGATPVEIIAYPIFSGQEVQIKYIGCFEPTPTHVFFDMNLVSIENSIDVNLNN